MKGETAQSKLLTHLATSLSERLNINLLSTSRNSIRKNVLPIGHNVDRGRYFETVKHAVAADTADLFLGGYLRATCRREWRNIEEIAPALVAVVTSPDALVAAIHPSQLVNIIHFAIAVARDPTELGRASLSIGFGGSVDEHTTARLPAYLIPGVEMLEGLRALYQRRLNIVGSSLGKSSLSARQVVALEREFGIAQTLPTLRIIFGTHMALALNYNEGHDRVMRRAEANRKALGEWLERYHPAIERHIQYLEDTRWEMLSTAQLTQLGYFTYLLNRVADTGFRVGAGADEGTVALVLRVLQARGLRRRSHMTMRESVTYAAVHSLVFGDDNQLPLMKGSVDNCQGFKFSVGCRTERLFNEIRRFVATRATPAGYRDYLLNSVRNENLRHRDALGELLSRVESRALVELISELDHASSIPNLGQRGLSELGIWLISTVGRHRPVYYYDQELDVPSGSSIADHIASLRSLTASGSDEERAIESIVYDYSALRLHERKYSQMTAPL